MPPTTFSPAEEKEARRLLASEKQSDNEVLLHWLGMLPAATSLDLLTKIANDVPKRRSYIGVAVAVLIVTTLIWIVSIALSKAVTAPSFSLLSLFSLFFVLEVNVRNNERTVRKAAFLLSYRDDYRAVAPLVRLWRARTATTVAAIKESEALEHALTRLLTALTDKGKTVGAEETVLNLLNRAFPNLPEKDKSIPEEISESRADLMLAALRYLASATTEHRSAEAREAIDRIASYPIRSFTPNRSLVYETAQAYLNPKYPVLTGNVAEPVAETLQLRL